MQSFSEHILPLLGKPIDDPMFLGLIAEHGQPVKSLGDPLYPEVSIEGWRVFTFPFYGIVLGAYSIPGLDPPNCRVFRHISLAVKKPDALDFSMEPFPDELPFCVKPQDTRLEVQKKIGIKPKVEDSADTFFFAPYLYIFDYDPKTNLLCSLIIDLLPPDFLHL